jgi:hypothetical protein
MGHTMEAYVNGVLQTGPPLEGTSGFSLIDVSPFAGQEAQLGFSFPGGNTYNFDIRGFVRVPCHRSIQTDPPRVTSK